jgi:hypothetical protein
VALVLAGCVAAQPPIDPPIDPPAATPLATAASSTAPLGNPAILRTPSDLALVPFEDAPWPRFLSRIELSAARDYVILGYLPPRVPFDLRGPERARASLARLLSDPLTLALSPARVGHLVVGWQCGGRRGVTSHSGDLDNRAFRLLAGGWGLAAMLSTYGDGGLVPAARFPRDQDRSFSAGQGVVLAAEVTGAECAAMRDRLAGFATSPRARRYGLLEDPGADGGAGCLSFGAYLAESAGLLGSTRQSFQRMVAVPLDLVGVLPAPPGVEAYRPAVLSGAVEARRVPLVRLLSQPWQGPQAETLRLPDGEAMLAALVAPRAGLAPPDDWRFARSLPESDAVIGRAASGARDWAARYPVRRIADPGGVAALVLER